MKLAAVDFSVRTTPAAVRERVPSRLRRKKQKGSALVELAISLLGFLMLTMGTLDFAWAVYANGFCYYSAREATRWVSVHGANSATSSNCSGNPGISGGCAANVSDVGNFISNMAIGLNGGSMAVSTSQPGCSTNGTLSVCTTWTPDTTPGSEANVSVSYLVTPLSGLGLKHILNVSSSSQMEMVH